MNRTAQDVGVKLSMMLVLLFMFSHRQSTISGFLTSRLTFHHISTLKTILNMKSAPADISMTLTMNIATCVERKEHSPNCPES